MTEVLNRDTGELIEVDEDAIAAEMSADGLSGEPEPELEPEPQEPPAPQGPSQQDMERGFKTVENAAKAYAKKVGEAFLEGVLNLQTCPLCADLVPAFVDMNLAGAVNDDAKAATLAYLGFAREQDYQPAPNIEACRICGGKGKVKTGSLVAGKETTTCSNCRGYGYFPPPNSGIIVTDANSPGIELHDPPLDPVVTGDVDVWGDPRILPDGRENPNYGRMPQYKQRIEPWGVTAGLTAQDV